MSDEDGARLRTGIEHWRAQWDTFKRRLLVVPPDGLQ